MAERDELWQVIYNADEPLPCPRYARRQCAGWDVSAECEVDAIYEAVIKHLTESGRLLPPGGEVSTEWSVVFKDGFRAKTFQRSMARAYRAWLDDPSIATVGPVEERTVTTWPDGTQLLGPWSPVVSDSSEVPSA